MRKKGMFCDLTISAGGEKFRVHKMILWNFTPYFKGKILDGASTIPVLDVSAEIFRKILEYAYTSTIHITDENAETLLKAACRIECFRLARACELFLACQINAVNLERLYGLSRNLNDTAVLAGAINEFIVRNFVSICEQRVFLQLEVDTIIAIIRSDELKVENEQVVLDALLRWIHYDKHREKYLRKAIVHIRWSLLTPDYIYKIIEQEEAIRNSVDSMHLILQVALSKVKPGLMGEEIEQAYSKPRFFLPSAQTLAVGERHGTLPYPSLMIQRIEAEPRRPAPNVTDNEPSLVTDNEPSLVTQNEPPLVTDNKPSLVTDNKPSLVTNKKASSMIDNSPASATAPNPHFIMIDNNSSSMMKDNESVSSFQSFTSSLSTDLASYHEPTESITDFAPSHPDKIRIKYKKVVPVPLPSSGVARELRRRGFKIVSSSLLDPLLSKMKEYEEGMAEMLRRIGVLQADAGQIKRVGGGKLTIGHEVRRYRNTSFDGLVSATMIVPPPEKRLRWFYCPGCNNVIGDGIAKHLNNCKHGCLSGIGTLLRDAIRTSISQYIIVVDSKLVPGWGQTSATGVLSAIGAKVIVYNNKGKVQDLISLAYD